MRPLKLGQILVQESLLRQEHLEQALAEQRRSGGKLGEVLLRLGLLTELQLTEALARQLRLPAVDLEALEPPEAALLGRVPAALARAVPLLPLEVREAERLLVVAVVDVPRPSDLEALHAATGLWAVPRLAGRGALARALERCYPHAAPAPLSPGPPRPALPSRAQHEPQALMRAVVDLLLDKGLITHAELLARLRG